MSLIIWGLAFYLLGFVAYLVGPLLIAPVFGYEKRRTLAMPYWKQAVITADRPQIVERKHGGHTLISTSFKPEWGDEGAIDDTTGHWRDELGLMCRLFQRPIGFISERYNVIADPQHCELGKRHIRWREDGKHKQTVQTGDGQSIEAFNPHLQVAKTPTLVSLHDIKGVLGGSAEPQLGEISYDYTEKSQSKFGQTSIVEAMAFVMAYAAAFGMMWFMARQGGSAAEAATDVSLMIGSGLLL